MLDSLRDGLGFQVMLVLLATAVIALLIVAGAAWGWWKWRQLVRRRPDGGWVPFAAGDLTRHGFAASGRGRAGGDASQYEPEMNHETPAAGATQTEPLPHGTEMPTTASGSPPPPTDPPRPGAPPPPTAERRPPPRSETRELFEQARRYATIRARQVGLRLRPEIDRAQQRLEQSAALRDAAARLRSVREAWDRPTSDTAPSPDAGGRDEDELSRRIDDLLAEQRTTNELLRALVERLDRT